MKKLLRHIPNTITSMNLVSGILGVICAVYSMPFWALVFMLAAAVFDFCDGLAARLLRGAGVPAYTAVGKELDSLSDMVSFGVLPALALMNCMQEQGVPAWLCYSALFIAVMSAVRLARFNVEDYKGTDFVGLATPSCALLCASFAAVVYEYPDSLPATLAGTLWFLPLVSLALGLLLVSRIPMFGMKVVPGQKLLDAKRWVFLLLAVLAIAADVIWWRSLGLGIFLVFGIYVIENLLIFLYEALSRPSRPAA